jgi:hypothetical protein
MFVSGAETKGLFNREDRGQVAWQRCKAAQERWAEEHACEDFSNYYWLAHASERCPNIRAAAKSKKRKIVKEPKSAFDIETRPRKKMKELVCVPTETACDPS